MKAVAKRAISMEMVGFEVIEKVAESSGNSGRIYVPKKWIGKKVRAVLLE
jgi:putative transposon-encoded protein